MDLSQLRTLIHVAELSSLSKAADRMHIAQPALSRQIRLLEEELSTSLFARHGRGMIITEAGREVVVRALRILAEVDEIRASMAEVNTSLQGRVVIGLPPTVAEIISVPLVGAVRKTHPNVELRFVTAFTGYLLDWLQRGEVDIAVLYDPQTSRSLRSQPLLIENLFLVSPPGAGLSIVRAVPFSKLSKETLLLPGARHGLRAIVERCASEAGIVLKVGIESDSLYSLKDLVANGFGSTILPLAPIHADVMSGRLSAAPLIEPAAVRRLVLSFSRDRRITNGARFVGTCINDIIVDLVQRGIWIGQLVESDQQRD